MADTSSSRIPDTTMDALIEAFSREAAAIPVRGTNHPLYIAARAALLSRLEARERELKEARQEKTDGYLKAMRERERVNELVANYESELTDVRSQNAEMMRVVEAATDVTRAWFAYPLAARDYLPTFDRERMPILASALNEYRASRPTETAPTPRHVCGLHGFGRHIDDSCPACDAISPKRTAPTQEVE